MADNARQRFLDAIERNAAAQQKMMADQRNSMNAELAAAQQQQREMAPGMGAIKGASMGSAFGPWGALIGAVTGKAAGAAQGGGNLFDMAGRFLNPMSTLKALQTPEGFQAGMGIAGNLASDMRRNRETGLKSKQMQDLNTLADKLTPEDQPGPDMFKFSPSSMPSQPMPPEASVPDALAPPPPPQSELAPPAMPSIASASEGEDRKRILNMMANRMLGSSGNY